MRKGHDKYSPIVCGPAAVDLKVPLDAELAEDRDDFSIQTAAKLQQTNMRSFRDPKWLQMESLDIESAGLSNDQCGNAA
jgi:hypothetical protein